MIRIFTSAVSVSMFLILLVAGCNLMVFRSVQCREIDFKLLPYFAGRMNDTIHFANQQGERRSFRIANKEIMHRASYTSDIGCSCRDFIRMLYLSGADSIWHLYDGAYVNDNDPGQYVEVTFVLDGIKTIFFESELDSTFSNVEVAGRSYKDPRVFSRKGDPDGRVTQCIIAPGQGLLRFSIGEGAWTREDTGDSDASIASFNYEEKVCR